MPLHAPLPMNLFLLDCTLAARAEQRAAASPVGPPPDDRNNPASFVFQVVRLRTRLLRRQRL
jgi:hypothetical protein